MSERKLPKTIRFLFYAVLLCFVVVSCRDESESVRSDVGQGENFVDEGRVRDIVNGISFVGKGRSSSGRKRLFDKTVGDIRAVKDEQDNTVFYVINYKPVGFMVMAADDRAMPVLAFSEDDNFSLDESKFTSGFADWFAYSKDYVQEIRKVDGELTDAQAQQWQACPILTIIYPPGEGGCDDGGGGGSGGGGCQDQTETVGPLLATNWGQGDGYNNFTPVAGCLEYANGHSPTGCVATAMAQVMRYHKFPATYNWAVMPNSLTFPTNSTGQNAISQLMVDVGVRVGMDYKCKGSGADVEEEVAPTLVGEFGYASANYLDYEGTSNQTAVKNNLRAKRPVIFRGGRRGGSWPIYTYEDGHAWVGDGFISTFHCEIGANTLYFHMNWGWTGSNNGWYAFNNFNPGSNTFNYKSGVVVNIRP